MAVPTQLFTSALDLRTFYETSVIRANPDPNETYIIFNQVKDLIEDLYKLKICEAVDTSKTFAVGDTYLSMKALPDDWRSTTKIILTPLSGSGQVPLYPVAFKQRLMYQKAFGKFYLDVKNKQFAITGSTGATMTINHFYQAFTAQMSVTGEANAIISWPTRFWPIIAYAAGSVRNGGFDPDAMAFRMSIAQQQIFDMLMEGLIAWDQDLKLADMDGRAGYADEVLDQGDDDSGQSFGAFLGSL